MSDDFSDAKCLPSFYYPEAAELLDFSTTTGISFEAWGVSQKHRHDTTEDDENNLAALLPSKPPKKRGRRPQPSNMNMNVTKRDPEFDLWCVEDLRNPQASGAKTDTIWNSWEEAQKHVWAVEKDDAPPLSSDVPEDEDSKQVIVTAIKAAMWITAYALDSKDTINNHHKNRREDILEYHAWKLLVSSRQALSFLIGISLINYRTFSSSATDLDNWNVSGLFRRLAKLAVHEHSMNDCMMSSMP